MSEPQDKPNATDSVDLSSLQGLDFGPSWEARKNPTSNKSFSSPSSGGKSFSGNRDRKPRNDSKGGDRRPRRDQKAAPYRPTVDVFFTAEETAFRALCKTFKGNCRTYELFEISKVILEKPERFLVHVRNLKGKDDTKGKPIFISLKSKLPFLTKEDGIAYTINNNLEDFFVKEEKEIDAPKGEFKFVNRCGITKKLLGPPNYHLYSQIVQEHQAVNLGNVSKHKFESSIEKVEEAEVIQEWVDSMTKTTLYVLKDRKENDPESFKSLEQIKQFLTNTKLNSILKEVDSTKFPATNVEQLPEGEIKKSILHEIDYQKRFPLNTANGLRGRLKRINFTVYKKGSQGVSYVCAVKRQPRTLESNFSESIQQLIDFIESNPRIHISDIPEKYLKIELPKSDESSETDQKKLSTEEETKVNQLKIELHWLVSEGHVTEYGNGELYISPVDKTAKPKKKAKVEHTSAKVEKSKDDKTKTVEADPIVEEKVATATEVAVEEVRSTDTPSDASSKEETETSKEESVSTKVEESKDDKAKNVEADPVVEEKVATATEVAVEEVRSTDTPSDASSKEETETSKEESVSTKVEESKDDKAKNVEADPVVEEKGATATEVAVEEVSSAETPSDISSKEEIETSTEESVS